MRPKKKIIMFVVMAALLVSIPLLSMDKSSLALQYNSMNKGFNAKMQTIKTREQYQEFMKDRTAKLNQFLETLKAAKATEETHILKIKVFIDLRKFDEGLKLIDEGMKKKFKRMAELTFEKCRIFLRTKKEKEAYALFKEVDGKVKKDLQYYETIYYLMFSVEDKEAQAMMAKKLVMVKEPHAGMALPMAYAYSLLADHEKDKGNLDKAIKWLQEGKARIKNPRALQQIDSSLKHYQLLNKPAAPVAAPTWYNSQALDLAKLKGKVVVIDFWATWCPPCRKVIPTLVKKYNELKDKGLIVIGYTRLYGSYRDELENLGPKKPEEEKKLIQGFLKRWKINYPIAIAENTDAFTAYGVTGIPTMVLIDKKGNVADIKVGSGDEKTLEEKIAKLLK